MTTTTKKAKKKMKKGKEKILMIYVNHDNKNAEAKNIPRGSKFIAFYFDANAREELRRCSVPIPVTVSRRRRRQTAGDFSPFHVNKAHLLALFSLPCNDDSLFVLQKFYSLPL